MPPTLFSSNKVEKLLGPLVQDGQIGDAVQIVRVHRVLDGQTRQFFKIKRRETTSYEKFAENIDLFDVLHSEQTGHVRRCQMEMVHGDESVVELNEIFD